MSKKANPKPKIQLSTLSGGLLGLVFAYAFVSRAFSTGSYWQYLASAIFLILGLKLIIKTFKIYHDRNTR